MTAFFLVLYIIGIVVWMKVEKKYFPYEEGEWTMEHGEAFEITEEMHNYDAMGRSIIWPICIAVLILGLIIKGLEYLFNKL